MQTVQYLRATNEIVSITTNLPVLKPDIHPTTGEITEILANEEREDIVFQFMKPDDNFTAIKHEADFFDTRIA